MVRTFSGHWVSVSLASSSSSAYAVMRKNHCSRSRVSTGVLAAPALAVNDLLVGQHGVVDRAPVHRRLAAVREPAFEHPDEQPLVPLVVLGVARRELTLPGVADPEALQLPLHVRDVAARRDLGMDAVLDRGVLGRQAERIPAERMQHVVAAHPLRARHHVADDVVAHVSDVGVAGRIREHLEAVELRLRPIDLNLECACGRPLLLPLRIEFLWMVVGHSVSEFGLWAFGLRLWALVAQSQEPRAESLLGL